MDRITVELRNARAGEPGAMNRLFATCGNRLLAYIRMRLDVDLRRRLESRDILQSTLLRAFSSMDSVRAENTASMMAWLARIADNEIRDQAAHHHRQRRDPAREQPLQQMEHAGLTERLRSHTSRIHLGQQMDRVAHALHRLQPDHREVILLRYFHELAYAEIGERMNRSADACRMLLARAMSALTIAMTERDP